MNILLIGSGAREHAIADALKRSRHKPNLFSIGTNRNPGIQALSEELIVLPSLTDIPRTLEIAKKAKPDFCIIGPEDPIAAGTANALEEIEIPTVAPLKNLAQIESSKGFARKLLQKYGIDASPTFKIFGKNISVGEEYSSPTDLNKFIEQDLQREYVVKLDCLKGGKGVKVSSEHLDSVKDGVNYALQCIEECGQVVIEEKLVGCEFSLMSFVSGRQVVHMPAVQDHKRAYEGDTGPNTGGMGSYSDASHSLPFLTTKELERAKEINQCAIEALQKEFITSLSPRERVRERGNVMLRKGEGIYHGILYGGYMAVKAGVKLIEFNCRFGDPEALNVLSILKSDFVDLCLAITSGELTEDLVKFESKATVCKVIVPKGYPENKSQKGELVTFPGLSLSHWERVRVRGNARTYFGDLFQHSDGSFVMGTSRTAGIVGIGNTIEEAERIAQSLCENVRGPVRFRSDIGTKELIQKRITMMETIRGKRYSLPRRGRVRERGSSTRVKKQPR